jgi:hypothetical protein
MRPDHLCSFSISSPSGHPTFPHSLLDLSNPSENIRGVLTFPRGYSLDRSYQRSRRRVYHPPCSTSRIFMHTHFTHLPEVPVGPLRVPEVHCVSLVGGVLLPSPDPFTCQSSCPVKTDFHQQGISHFSPS